MPTYADVADGIRIPSDDLRAWTARVVEAVGTPADVAADVAEVLVASDRRSIASHGTARLPNYIGLVDAGVLDPAARPELERGRSAFASFDAHNGWGHHAGRVAMDWAIDAAARNGVALAVVRNSNHYGIAGWYALRATARGMIGLSLTNSSPLVAPTRAIRPLLGTNPIALAAPREGHEPICLDMATSTVPRGRLEVAARRGESLRPGWALGPDGRPTESAEDGLAGALQPLAGDEESGGYKGYGLALMVDLLTGVLASASYGPNIAGLFSTEGPSDLGHAFLVVDPTAIGGPGEFAHRSAHLAAQLVGAEAAPDAPGRVLIPGEPEADAEAQADRVGVVIDRVHARALADLGARLAVPFPAQVP